MIASQPALYQNQGAIASANKTQKNLDIPANVCYYISVSDNYQIRRFTPCHTHHHPTDQHASLKVKIYVFLLGLFLLLLFRLAMVG